MARFGTWVNGVIVLNNGTTYNFSDHAREITLETSVAELPDDVHGDNVAKVAAGLEDWTITATFLQGFAAASIDVTMNLIGGVGHTPFVIEVGASAAAVSATNPRYSGTAILASYGPLRGAHGSNLETQATFRPASRLTRRTT